MNKKNWKHFSPLFIVDCATFLILCKLEWNEWVVKSVNYSTCSSDEFDSNNEHVWIAQGDTFFCGNNVS